jgi:hypothetical protein
MKNARNEANLTIEKKKFNLHDDHDSFFTNNSEQVKFHFDIFNNICKMNKSFFVVSSIRF